MIYNNIIICRVYLQADRRRDAGVTNAGVQVRVGGRTYMSEGLASCASFFVHAVTPGGRDGGNLWVSATKSNPTRTTVQPRRRNNRPPACTTDGNRSSFIIVCRGRHE